MVYMASTKGLFKVDEATRMVSVETLVVLTTMLLVVRFIVDFMGPRVQSGHCRYHHRDGELFPSALYHGDDAAVGGEGERLLPGVGGAAGRSAVQRQDRAPVQQVHADPPARHHGLLVGGQSHPRTDLPSPQDPSLVDLGPERGSHHLLLLLIGESRGHTPREHEIRRRLHELRAQACPHGWSVIKSNSKINHNYCPRDISLRMDGA
jgi:hypothetical protein